MLWHKICWRKCGHEQNQVLTTHFVKFFKNFFCNDFRTIFLKSHAIYLLKKSKPREWKSNLKIQQTATMAIRPRMHVDARHGGYWRLPQNHLMRLVGGFCGGQKSPYLCHVCRLFCVKNCWFVLVVQKLFYR